MLILYPSLRACFLGECRNSIIPALRPELEVPAFAISGLVLSLQESPRLLRRPDGLLAMGIFLIAALRCWSIGTSARNEDTFQLCSDSDP